MLWLRTRRWIYVGALAATLAVAGACGGDDDDDGGDTTPSAAATSPTAAAATSAAGAIDISGIDELSDGTLDVGSDVAYAPIEFFDEADEIVGLDVDLANAIGEALGVEVVFNNAGFDTLLPALDSERYDVVISAMTVNPERSQQVDFVEYFNAGAGIIVPAGNPNDIQGLEDMCGFTVAAQKGTVQVDYLTEQSDTCTTNGDEPIEIREFDTDPEAVQALIAGQADAETADFPVAAYSAQQNEGRIELLEVQIDPAPYGIAVRKDSTALRDALQEAFEQIRDDGTYDTILTKWDLSSGALE